MGFKGNVESFSLADVFQNLGQNRQTGTLHIFTPENDEKWVWFQDGRLVGAVSSARKPYSLLNVLRGRGLVGGEAVTQARELRQSSNQPLAACLKECAGLTDEQMLETTRNCVELEIHELFGWEKAQYDFTESAPPIDIIDAADAPPSADLPLSHVIMEAARRMDEWERFRTLIPQFTEVYTIDADVRRAFEDEASRFTVLETRLADLVDGSRDIDDLTADSFLYRYEVLEILAGFVQGSVVRRAKIEELDQAQRSCLDAEQKSRRAKLLERMLALGDARPEIRRALGETLADLGQMEKASLHFAVLAEEEERRGDEEAAIGLYRQIAVLSPKHIGARTRLAEYHLRLNRRAEAIVHFRELSAAYLEKGRLKEAREICERALAADPNQLDLQREVIRLSTELGEKETAAGQWEQLGDRHAAVGQNREAADAYRHALQLLPNAQALRKKFADVRLSSEERESLRRRRLLFAGGLSFVGLIALALVGWEWRNNGFLNQAREARAAAQHNADAFKAKKQLNKAADEYAAAAAAYHRSALALSPFLGVSAAAKKEREDLWLLEKRTREEWEKLGVREGFAVEENFSQALKARTDWRLEDALESLRLVEENQFASEELRGKAKKERDDILALLRDFQVGFKRATSVSASDFTKGVEEEFEFKRAFVERFEKYLALRRRRGDAEVQTDILMPLATRSSMDGVRVFLDGVLVGEVGIQGDVFRRPMDVKNRVFEFRREGFQPLTVNTRDLKALRLDVELSRIPAKQAKLPAAATAVYSGTTDGNLWLGSADGELLQVRPHDLETVSRISLAGDVVELNRAVVGELHLLKNAGGDFFCAALRSGECLAVRRETGQIMWRRKFTAHAFEGVPILFHLPILADKPAIAAISGKKLYLLEAETGTLVGGETVDLPEAPSGSPAAFPEQNMIVVGFRDGTLRGWSLSQRRWLRTWRTDVPSGICGTPLTLRDGLAAAAGETLFFFELAGQSPTGKIQLPGTPITFPVRVEDFAYYGCTIRGAVCAVDLSRRSLRWGRNNDAGRMRGEFPFRPAILEQRLYFASTQGRLYALDRATGKDLWHWDAGITRPVSAPPLVVERRVFFFSNDGSVIAFDE
jgi:outer membrane protein assembly factor BamB/tetratricopeptide (TPR) repeat protein